MKKAHLHPLAQLDHEYVWHPFTQMLEWLAQEPIVIVAGKGAYIYDVYGRRFLDGNASIWTNLHGHRHPVLNRAIRAQLSKIAHSSALGLANEPASLFAEALIKAANPRRLYSTSISASQTTPSQHKLRKVFYSDDGSTAIEVAIKLSFEFVRRAEPGRTARFMSLANAYHGDTLGAVSIGHIELFHSAYKPLLFNSLKVDAPYCYRCRYNKARPERVDARLWKKCKYECIGKVQQTFEQAKKKGRPITCFVYEPRLQGPAGMIAQPEGWLQQVATIARQYGALLIADEVMTGFGRAVDVTDQDLVDEPILFASHQEGVQPDLMALGKGITGGYLPLAATVVTQQIFDVFLGPFESLRQFFHGHSYTANQLATSAALASLRLLTAQDCTQRRLILQRSMRELLPRLWRWPVVGDIRQCGSVAAIELVKHWKTKEPFELKEKVGFRVCQAMANRGVLTRPVGNVIVFMLPYCAGPKEVELFIWALEEAIVEVFNLQPTP